MKVDIPVIAGHAAPVTDCEFNPFDDHMIATASEDSTIKIWNIPTGGLTTNISDPLVDLTNHGRKVTLLRFNPTANNVLASTSADQTVKVWDIEKGSEINSYNDVQDLIQELVWDHCGNNVAITSKDKSIRVIDGRSGKLTTMIENSHEGTKSIKLTYLGPSNRILSVGFNKQSMRQMKIWDARNTSEEVFRVEFDQAAGTIMPFYDVDTGLVYLAGKGDGNVRCFEIPPEDNNAYLVTDFRSNVSAKGMAFVPKRGLNIMGNETARLLKLTTNSVDPLRFHVPRKSEGFREDIFPDTFSGVPSHSADEWIAGSDLPPKTMSLNPANAAKGEVSPRGGPRAPVKTVASLTAELEKANARIKQLEERLAAANLSIE
jgi:coronin-1B/1C/6